MVSIPEIELLKTVEPPDAITTLIDESSKAITTLLLVEPSLKVILFESDSFIKTFDSVNKTPSESLNKAAFPALLQVSAALVCITPYVGIRLVQYVKTSS